MEPNLTDWLHLTTRLRPVQDYKKHVIRSGDPFSAAAYAYYVKEGPHLQRFGVQRLFLCTKDARSARYYELSANRGHIAQAGTPPPAGNYSRISSRSYELTSDATSPKDGLRLQIVAHSDDVSKEQEQAILLYCNALASEILISTRERYFAGIEDGVVDIDRLHNRYRGDAILPGTYAAGLTISLSRAIRANAAIYCVLFNGRFHLEYAHVNFGKWKHWARLLRGVALQDVAPEEVEDRVRQISSKEHVIIDRGSMLFSAIRKQVALLSHTDLSFDSLVLAPVIYDGEVVGAFAFAFGSESPVYSASARHLVARAAENFARPARYLFQRRSGLMIVDPIFKSRETRVDASSCFLVMPFGEAWSDAVFSSLRGILAEEGLSLIRADDLFGENVIEDIWSAILRSGFVVADVTGRNPNVYYELGIAHTLGKKVILLSQRVEDIPFDTRHLRHVIYSNSLSGFEAIRRGIKGFLANR